MNILDIKGLKTPSKEVEIHIINEDQKITIYPIAGFGLLKLEKLMKKLQEDTEDTDLQEQVVKLALKDGCKADEETIQFLIDQDVFACMKLVEEVLQFSGEYAEAKSKELNIAKKKLKK